jgi:hypothetical protein
MNIVIGRGSRRQSFEMPCAEIVKRSPKKEQAQASKLVCNMLGIKKVKGA